MQKYNPIQFQDVIGNRIGDFNTEKGRKEITKQINYRVQYLRRKEKKNSVESSLSVFAYVQDRTMQEETLDIGIMRSLHKVKTTQMDDDDISFSKMASPQDAHREVELSEVSEEAPSELNKALINGVSNSDDVVKIAEGCDEGNRQQGRKRSGEQQQQRRENNDELAKYQSGKLVGRSAKRNYTDMKMTNQANMASMNMHAWNPALYHPFYQGQAMQISTRCPPFGYTNMMPLNRYVNQFAFLPQYDQGRVIHSGTSVHQVTKNRQPSMAQQNETGVQDEEHTTEL